jgi:hypothetical protein
MIPGDPVALEKMRKLADRNIVNGDWGDEVAFPGEEVQQTPEEQEAKGAVSQLLTQLGKVRLPKRK